MQEETVTEEGKMEEARAVFRDAIDDMPSDAALWCNYRATYFHEENYLAALPYFQKAIELSPSFNGPYLSAGMCLTGLGLHEDALRLYDQAIRDTR